MNDLDFSFEASPWEAFLMTKGMGETISAVTLLSLMEGQDEQQLEDAMQDLETGCMFLDISLPFVIFFLKFNYFILFSFPLSFN